LISGQLRAPPVDLALEPAVGPPEIGGAGGDGIDVAQGG
jgi:hypothetical protein